MLPFASMRTRPGDEDVLRARSFEPSGDQLDAVVRPCLMKRAVCQSDVDGGCELPLRAVAMDERDSAVGRVRELLGQRGPEALPTSSEMTWVRRRVRGHRLRR